VSQSVKKKHGEEKVEAAQPMLKDSKTKAREIIE